MSDLYRIDKERRIHDSDLIASYAAIDGLVDRWVGALVPVERCKHGYLDKHPIREHGIWTTCPGAGIGGDDE